MKNAAVDMGEQAALWDTDFVSFEWFPRIGIAGSNDSSSLSFFEDTPQYFPQWL